MYVCTCVCVFIEVHSAHCNVPCLILSTRYGSFGLVLCKYVYSAKRGDRMCTRNAWYAGVREKWVCVMASQ